MWLLKYLLYKLKSWKYRCHSLPASPPAADIVLDLLRQAPNNVKEAVKHQHNVRKIHKSTGDRARGLLQVGPVLHGSSWLLVRIVLCCMNAKPCINAWLDDQNEAEK